MRFRRVVPRSGRFVVLVVLAGTVSACGGSSVDDDGVAALVDGEPITIQQVVSTADAAMATLPAEQGALIAPKYEACVKAIRAAAPRGGRPSVVQARRQCAEQRELLKQQALQQLITAAWLSGEAQEQGIVIPDAQVVAETKRRVDAQRRLAGAERIDRAQVEQMVRSELASAKVFRAGRAADASEQQLRAWYASKGRQLARLASRDVLMIRVAGRARADATAAALRAGRSFASVARNVGYSPPTSMTAVTRQGLDRRLGAAVFAATTGEVIGPVRTQGGDYAVFEVTGRTAAGGTPAFAQSRRQIQMILASEAEKRAVARKTTDFRKRWRAKTECADGYRLPVCANVDSDASASMSAG